MHQEEQLIEHKTVSEVEHNKEGKEFGQAHQQSVQLHSVKVVSNLNLNIHQIAP